MSAKICMSFYSQSNASGNGPNRRTPIFLPSYLLSNSSSFQINPVDYIELSKTPQNAERLNRVLDSISELFFFNHALTMMCKRGRLNELAVKQRRQQPNPIRGHDGRSKRSFTLCKESRSLRSAR